MRILVATDAWHPQVNGVVRTYEKLQNEAQHQNAELNFITPADFFSLPCPTYPEIKLALARPGKIATRIRTYQPDHIHVATEGPLGLLTRRYCLKNKIPFTTSYHTRFPEYISARFPVSENWAYRYMRRFHNSSAGIMVATPTLAQELGDRGFVNIMPWTRGVALDQFYPRDIRLFGSEPVFIYVGRVAVEKNITAFLDLNLPGKKVVVGDGPQRRVLEEQYKDVIFTGPQQGERLAEHYASADVFVFPSRTDTFGIVLLEALASGLPVAAYPVVGPRDVIEHGKTGILSDDLQNAAIQAMGLNSENCQRAAQKYSWAESARQFLQNVSQAGSVLSESNHMHPAD